MSEYILTAADRCDRCGAQAFVRVSVPYVLDVETIGVADLLFCGHHFTKHEQALRSNENAIIVDEREKLNEKPSLSATKLD